MNKVREIKSVLKSNPTLEGAGVHLRRAFGFPHLPELDPFLLLDDFRSNNPDDYLAGFPWHPHRGIETITYVLEGRVEHGDNMGNNGTIGPGDVQWMTAGSGIIHQEMPKAGPTGHMGGFQLWANLPASQKMMAPRYRDVKSSEIPLVKRDSGVTIRVICGKVGGIEGPVKGIVTDPEYLDITLPPRTTLLHPVASGYSLFAYLFDGQAMFGPENKPTLVQHGHLVIFEEKGDFSASCGNMGARFLLVSGKPIREPVAWAGPIVMNTQDELKTAFEEYENGTFLKHG